MQKTNKNYWIKKLLVFLLISTIVYYMVLFIIFLSATGMKFSSVLIKNTYKPYEYMDQDYISELAETYGSENITIVSDSYPNVYFNLDANIIAINETFIDNGVPDHNSYAKNYYTQKVKLLNGEIWEQGSTELVTVIDLDTAMDYYKKQNPYDENMSNKEWVTDNIIGEKIQLTFIVYNGGENLVADFEVIGVVSNTTSKSSEERERDHVTGYSNIFIPYYFSRYNEDDSIAFNNQPKAVVVNTGNFFNTFKLTKWNKDQVIETDDGTVYNNTVSAFDVIRDGFPRENSIIMLIIIDVVIIGLYGVYKRYKPRNEEIINNLKDTL